MPAKTAGIVNARNLEGAHRGLVPLLRPGMRVLDVGCGGAAITTGIAEVVGPEGLTVGVDQSDDLLATAPTNVPGMALVRGDGYRLSFDAAFDIVTAARVLQWLDAPGEILRQMAFATKPGGRVVVLDYNHERIAWDPAPPASMARFYQAFLDWRAAAGMDNAIADRLPDMFARAGLVDVATTVEDEVTERGAADFASRAGLWGYVAASRGHQMVADGAVTETERATAETDHAAWVADGCRRQVMHLRCVVSRKL
jgi:SAM-dependent methyltransferase